MVERHPRDAAATRERLLQAALAEFAEHGLAGARVDRIAGRAESNKRLLYSYFGDKETVFAAVLDLCGTRFNDAVPFTAEDLPGYAGAVFDYLSAEPLLHEVLARRDVERAAPTPLETRAYRSRITAIGAAQAAGRVRDGIDPADLLIAVEGLVRSSLHPRVGLRAADGPETAARRRRHRKAVVEATRRIVEPVDAPR